MIVNYKYCFKNYQINLYGDYLIDDYDNYDFS